MKYNLWMTFCCGFISSLSLYSLFQDCLGREGYVAYVQTHWVSAWFSVPLVIVALAMVLVTFASILRKTGKKEKTLVDSRVDEAIEDLRRQTQDRSSSSFFPEAVGIEEQDE